MTKIKKGETGRKKPLNLQEHKQSRTETGEVNMVKVGEEKQENKRKEIQGFRVVAHGVA